MDTLHSMLRTIRAETKSDTHHLDVFREFLAHLDKIQRATPAKSTRTKAQPLRKIVKRAAG